MQKLALFAGAVVMAFGVTAASSSAFAMGCLDQGTTASLSQENSLASYTGGSGSSLTDQYSPVGQSASLNGNACSVTQQSLPYDQQHHNGHPQGQPVSSVN